MQTFPAQVKSGDQDVDVVITIADKHVAIDAGDRAIGRWKTKHCSFERTAPTAYRFHTEDDWLTIRISDDSRFRQALALMREENVPLVPRPLMWIGAVAITSAIAATAFITIETPAEAHPDSEAVAPTPTLPVVATSPPTTIGAPVPASTAGDLVARWNEIAGSSHLALTGAGLSEFGRAHSVDVGDGSIVVTAEPNGDSDQATDIMATMGLTIAAIDPTASPADRADVLADLGLDVDGSNTAPLDRRIVRGSITYQLQYEPGGHIVFSAGLEW